MDNVFASPFSRAAIFAVGILLAMYTAWFSFGVAVSKSSNDLIGRLPVQNHLVTAELLRRSYSNDVRRNSGLVSEAIAGRYVALARDIYSHEPLSQFATSVVAMDPAIDKSKARQIMQLSLQLSRRNSVASAWLANDAIVRRDLQGILYYYDLIMHRQNAESQAVLAALVELLAEERSRPFFVKLLRTYSDWHADFWKAAMADNKAIRNAWMVRDRLVDVNYAPAKSVDEFIIARMVEAGYYEQAWLLYPRVRKEVADFVGSRLVVNLDFDRRTQLEPYFWVLNDLNGEIGVSFNKNPSSVDLSIVGKTSGSVVKRLVYLADEIYRVDLRLKGELGSSDEVEYRLGATCVDATVDAVSVKLERSSEHVLTGQLRIPANDCRFFWMDLFVMNNSSEGVDITVQNIVLDSSV